MSSPRRLSDEVHVLQHYLRSAHLEHHEGETASTYIPTARALDVLHRITRSMTTSDTGRAWSLTGPYGSGKSSFALFVHALLGADADRARAAAEHTLDGADAELSRQLQQARRTLGAADRGFIRATATAQREPIVDTVLRALTAGASAYWPNRIPTSARAALKQANSDRNPRAIGIAVEAMCEHAPVLIAIDEFGKNLEHFASDPAAADLFVLQELAERCTGARGLPAFLVTLQHLAFDDYVRGASAVQRREWGKVQGRFEDIPFLDSAEQSLRLVAGAFDTTGADQGFIAARQAWAQEERETCERLGLSRLLAGGGDTIEACYPLHPLTSLVLPDMCARFGQNGRTLFSFLTSREPHSVAGFLAATPLSAPLPTVGVTQVYDFFLATGAGTGGRHAARLAEIDTTIRETTGLTEPEQRVLKVIGVLNLLSQGGPLRASLPVIRYALAPTEPLADLELCKLLDDLQRRGVITYRNFADEYRLWQGSDLDLGALVAVAREELATASPAALLTEQHRMPPAIAARHSQRVGMLRYFDTVFADPTTKAVDVEADPDGLLVYFLGPPQASRDLTVSLGPKPVVVATTTEHATITEAIVELSAVMTVLGRVDVLADRVAKRELQDRAADARRRLHEAIAAHLRPGEPGVELRLIDEDRPLQVRRSLSRVLSDVCDTVYRSSPEIRNEMLGRRELTSQAAKARRELLTAMVDHPTEEWLGLTGYGPEKAMYAALLRHTGMHRLEHGTYGYHPPRRDTGTVWGILAQLVNRATGTPLTLDRVYAALVDPPIGLKDGPIPVFVAAFLIHRADDVAIYQDGTYQPTLSAELLERLVKTPDRFAVKSFALAGTRTALLGAVGAVLGRLSGSTRSGHRGGARRNNSVLAVAAPLLHEARSLPAYTLRTTNLPSDVEAVRNALLGAREPDELLFTDLPKACGVRPFSARSHGRDRDVTIFAERLTIALGQLRQAYPQMLTDCCCALSTEFSLDDELDSLRAGLRARARPLLGTLLDPKLRSFTLLVSDTKLDDDAWLEALLNNLTGRPPSSWRDEDVSRFALESRAIAGLFNRVLALHYDALTTTTRDSGFEAHRVTVTSRDGGESSSVVWIDHEQRSQLEETVQAALAAAEQLVGPRGGQSLLALLAGTVLPGRQTQILSQQHRTTADTEQRHA